MYNITFTKNVKKFLKSHNTVAILLGKKLPILQKDPYSKTLDTKRLELNKNEYRRIRIWKYRLVYQVRHTEVVIHFLEAWSRWDIYK